MKAFVFNIINGLRVEGLNGKNWNIFWVVRKEVFVLIVDSFVEVDDWVVELDVWVFVEAAEDVSCRWDESNSVMVDK